MLDVVGNNLANVSTHGFKTQRIRFSSQFAQTLEAQSAPTKDSGGSNPVEVGLGVQTASTDTQFTQGTYESTGNKLDMGIQGNGFFMVRDGDQFLATRTGAFAVDGNNYMVDPSTGNRLQRLGTVGEGTATAPAFQISGDNDIRIPKGITIPGQATRTIEFRGNLDARAELPLATVLLSGQPLTSNGAPVTENTLLSDLDQTNSDYQAGDRILITGTRSDGSAVETAFSATGTASDTVGALLQVINTAFLSATPGLGATAALDASGYIKLTANTPGRANLNLALSSDPADANSATGLTDFTTFRLSVDGREGGAVTTVMEIFDDQFAAHNVSFTMRKVGANLWDITASLPAGTATIKRFGEDNIVTGLSFNEDGSFKGLLGSKTAQSLALGSPLTEGQTPVSLTTSLDLLDQHSQGPYQATDAIVISGKEHDGREITPVNFSPEGKTVEDLITAINDAFQSASAVLDASGNIVLSSDVTGQSDLSMRLDELSTNSGRTDWGQFREAVRGSDGDDDITFEITSLAGFGSNQTIQLTFGDQNGFNGLTQFGGFSSAASTDQDGFAQGTLVDQEVQKDGTILGQFSNGRTEALAQVALVTFANQQGLERVGGNYFSYNGSSGQPIYSAPGSGGSGTVQGGVLEASNVDVGIEFTQLITAQRGFQVNARAFSIANQVLEETANLLR